MAEDSKENNGPNPETAPSYAKVNRRIGFMAGKLRIPDDFDTMGRAEIEQLFYGEETRADQ